MAACVVTLDVNVDPSNVEEGLYGILGHVRSNWEKGAIKFKKLASFLSSNQNTICYVTDDMVDGVIIRVCGGMRDTQQELAANKLLNAIGASAKLLCTFKNGVCHEFLAGTSFSWMDIEPFRDIELAKAVARELAKIHSKQAQTLVSYYDIKDDVVLFGALHGILQNWPEKTGDPDIDDLLSNLPPRDSLENEIGVLMQMVAEEGIPTVFGHNDANPTNVIYDTAKGKATMVDFEVCGMSPETYDLSSFLESSAIGMYPDPDSRRHSESFQKDFLREYIQTKKQLDTNTAAVTEAEVDKLYVQITKTALIVYLISTMAFVAIGAHSSPESAFGGKDLVGLGLTRFMWYQSHKDQIMAMKSTH